MVALSLTTVACGRLHDARPNAKLCLAGAKALATCGREDPRLPSPECLIEPLQGMWVGLGVLWLVGLSCLAGVAVSPA
ncbi:hypothetical protein CBM2615_B140001 [Cupriavidus taiwanensis]|uniref:Uncharacterized protein n=1 Tax=Cupriavidus taiwanensis TaxID=164546 RepID=A0A375E5X2_9BURK|nr:hypothetical protein CBM2614_B140001 [Cupriavidus taiwanensis]SOZ64017.1 hypothetical protein CBM2615_B140001 [Cupriavidus taiwanensis]SOZ67779.1 hypothetical protein CBM2613_B110001 [Cupriavidus taiwanensis]SPA07726.1 hypothetical protein CBM2625_B110001 [Cupriavidus taiwanensis]